MKNRLLIATQRAESCIIISDRVFMFMCYEDIKGTLHPIMKLRDYLLTVVAIEGVITAS